MLTLKIYHIIQCNFVDLTVDKIVHKDACRIYVCISYIYIYNNLIIELHT